MMPPSSDQPACVPLPAGEACLYEHPYRVFDDVFCIRACNASPMSFEGTNTWVVHPAGASACAVIDPATDEAAHWGAIEALAASRGARIGEVLLTHGHPDHAQGAQAFAEKHHARYLARKDGLLVEGDLLLCAGALKARVVPLAGHSGDSVGIVLPRDKALFSGDTFFSRGWTVITKPDGSLADYFATLDRIEALVRQGAVCTVLPGHREVMDAVTVLRRLGEYRTHRLERLDEVRAAHERLGSWDVDALVAAVYTDLDNPVLIRAATMSLACQIEYLKQNEEPC